MRAGFILPGGTAPEQLELAILAEDNGWDGVFAWEGAYGVDPWGLLSAIAVRTRSVRLGTVLTPLPWRRPWKVASQVATLDQLSNGRAIITVGVGAITEDLPLAAEVVDLRARADLMDDGIDLMRALWRGDARYEGAIHDLEFGRPDQLEVSRPIQDQIPIWVVGVWPRMKSMRRVLRCDGVVPQFTEGGHRGSPDQIRAMREWLADQGARAGLDVIAEGQTPADDPVRAAEEVKPWADAGCTWWMETNWEMPHHSRERMDEVRARLEAGPPTP